MPDIPGGPKSSKKTQAAEKLVTHINTFIPSFTDIFDERTFYITFAVFTVIVTVFAFFAAWYWDLSIQDSDMPKPKKKKTSGDGGGNVKKTIKAQ